MSTSPAAPSPQQFALDLLQAPAPTLENFVRGANGAALAALRDALAGRGAQFIHLWGPQGSGRTHLLEAVRAAAAAGAPDCARRAPESVPVFCAAQRVYVVDDVQALDEAQQAALFALQNRVRDHAGATLITAADLPPAALRLRDDVRTRLGWGLVFALRPISEGEQAEALQAHALARGLRMDPDVVPYMLQRLPRDMRTLVAALEALDAFALARRSALTLRLLREWLRQGGADVDGGAGT